MTSAWWAAFGPAETRVSCGGGQHLVRWAEGGLRAADHPDAEGELVLAALGGDATPCLDLVQAWCAHSDDLAVLAIGPRSESDKLTVTPAALEELGGGPGGTGWFAPSTGTTASYSSYSVARVMARRGWSGTPAPMAAPRAHGGGFIRAGGIRSRASYGTGGVHRHPRRWPGMDEEPKRGQLLALLAIGAPFQWRLAGAVAHAWSADGPRAGSSGRARPALRAALAGRLAPAAAQWLGVDPAHVEVSIHDQDGWGDVDLARAGERRLHATMPLSWLARVWAPGLAVVGSHLVVSMEDADWPQARVLALPSPGRQPVELTVRSDGRQWSIAR
jgi:hypothetical protein